MNIIAKRDALLHACRVAELAVSGRTPKPILMCVRLTAHQNRVDVSGTNLERYITASTQQVQTEQVGESVVVAEKIIALLDDTPDETVRISSDGNMLRMTSNDSEFKLYEQKASDFPPEPKLFEAVTRKLPARLLQAMFNQTRFAASKESHRQSTGGSMLRFDPDGLVAVATDGRRLARTSCSCGDTGAMDVVVPSGAIDCFISAELEPEETVTVEATDNLIAFDSFNFRLVTKLVEGVFPSLDDLLQTQHTTFVKVGRDKLRHALSRAAMLTDHKRQGIRMTVSEKEVTLVSGSKVGSVQIGVPCLTTGPGLDIGLNPAYLLDGLEAVTSEEVTIEMTDPIVPARVRSGDYSYILMPVRLD